MKTRTTTKLISVMMRSREIGLPQKVSPQDQVKSNNKELGNGVMEQNTNYFDKVLKLLISERIKTTKLTAKIEQLQMQNDSRKASFFPQEYDIPTLQTPERSISAEIPVPLFVETPEIHVKQERENEKLHKEITALKRNSTLIKKKN